MENKSEAINKYEVSVLPDVQLNSEVKIFDEGKIDIHKRQQRYERAIGKLAARTDMIPENKEFITSFLRHCALGRTVIGKAKKKIGPARCLKYLELLTRLSIWFDKPFDKVVQADMESLVERLETGILKRVDGKELSPASRYDIKRTIKKFWKWLGGNAKFYPEIVEWIDSCEPVTEIPALSRAEVDRLIEYCRDPRSRALVTVLFDSGARIEELLNVRLKPEHLSWRQELGVYRIRLEFSKTKPRTVTLPLSTEVLKQWLDIHPARGNPNAQLFPMSYASVSIFLGRLGRRVLGKRVSAHLFRHSSATFYATKLSRYQLCYRFGWTMSSKVVDRYLDREGLLEESVAETVLKNEESTRQSTENSLVEELRILKEAHIELVERNRKLQEQVSGFKEGRGWGELALSDTRQKSEELSRTLSRIKELGRSSLYRL